jgi:hypothetical protein
VESSVVLAAEDRQPPRGAAYEARLQAQLDDLRVCIGCGIVGVQVKSCASGIHCYCERCEPEPCACQS